MKVIAGANVAELRAFLLANVEVGSVIMTDGLAHYKTVCGTDNTHKPFVASESSVHAHVALPPVHRMASLLKRWLMSTHQGDVAHHHLQSYLDEFYFRFNRRKSRQRGMLFYRLLEQAVASAPISQDQVLTRTVTRQRRQSHQ